MDLETALEFINQVTSEKVGRSLRAPEITIMEGTWKGLTYAQMADVSSYSTNYLMRDIGPKFWRLLSDAFGEPISKTNIRVVLDRFSRGSANSGAGALESVGVRTDERVNRGPIVSRSGGKDKLFASSSYVTVPAQDWSQLTAPTTVYGRHQEISTLSQWLTTDGASLLGLWGLSGIGKTTVLKMLSAQVQKHYDQILWRSLQHAPRIQDILATLPNSPDRSLTLSDEDALVECINLLQAQSCVLILDDVDGILQGQQLAGHYQPGYETYGALLQRFCTKNHQSCIVLSGLEPPKQVLRLHEQNALVRLLPLTGLADVDALAVLEGEQLIGAETWNQLVHYYEGHPLGLKLASKLIRDLFHGNATEFLDQKLCLLDDIRHLLEKTINRLSPLELEVLYFLATSGQSASLATLQTELAMTTYPIKLLEALDSLKQRSLLKTVQSDDQSLFTLDVIVKETVIKQLISQVGGTEAASPTSQRYRSAAGVALRLTPATPEKVHLSDWLDGVFMPSWQAITALFGRPMKASLRLRSTYQLRDEAVIKRFKQVRLGPANAPQASVVLLVAISRESDKTVQVCIQSQPDQTDHLPTGLALCLLDGEAQVLAQVNADQQDSFIQLPYFSGGFQESFSIQLQLDGLAHTEEFVI